MTDNRFEFTAFDCAYITDHEKHKDYPFVDKPEYIQEIVDLLNEQDQDINELKWIIEDYFNKTYRKDVKTLLFILSVSELPILSKYELEAISRVQGSMFEEIVDIDKLKKQKESL